MKVYTDGSCLGNPGPGGWAFRCEDGFTMCGAEHDTTNNRMEMLAIIRALEHNPRVTIVTDSTYVRDGIQKWIHNWKKNNWKTSSGTGVKNRDLWEKLDNLKHTCTEFEWVKAHAGNEHNEYVDTLARNCANLLKNQNP